MVLTEDPISSKAIMLKKTLTSQNPKAHRSVVPTLAKNARIVAPDWYHCRKLIPTE